MIIAIRVVHAGGRGSLAASTPLSHIIGVVLAPLEMGGCPVSTLIGLTIPLAGLPTQRVIPVGMLGSPTLGVQTAALFLAVGTATGTLTIAKSWVGFKALVAKAATADSVVTHRGFSEKTTQMKPSTENPEATEGRKSRQEEPITLSPSLKKVKKQRQEKPTTLNQSNLLLAGKLTNYLAAIPSGTRKACHPERSGA